MCVVVGYAVVVDCAVAVCTVVVIVVYVTVVKAACRYCQLCCF